MCVISQTENEDFLTQQLITYLGNKRSLLDFIGQGVKLVQKRLKKQKLDTFDVFSGSGIVARYFKQFSHTLITNDLEAYSYTINNCYLSNKDNIDLINLQKQYDFLCGELKNNNLKSGFITDLYAPKNDEHIQKGERVFYTHRNAQFIDTARQLIHQIPPDTQTFFLAPLLAQASVHANTSGVFKGFYKSSETGIGHFGGKKQDALFRIKGNIELLFPVFSNFNCRTHIYQQDANNLVNMLPQVDLAYIDPPYNQHPYGSNYFMLNVILHYTKPEHMSKVSGIPQNWNRSNYNKPQKAYKSLHDLVSLIKAKFVLISFNSEGFITPQQMLTMLMKFGKVEILEQKYNTFRASRNLYKRKKHVTEFLYVLEKK